MDSAGNLQIADVMMAKRRIQDYARVTPLIRAEGLEKLFGGAEVWLKLENLQHTGSFKVRGVANKKTRSYSCVQREPRAGCKLYGQNAGNQSGDCDAGKCSKDKGRGGKRVWG